MWQGRRSLPFEATAGLSAEGYRQIPATGEGLTQHFGILYFALPGCYFRQSLTRLSLQAAGEPGDAWDARLAWVLAIAYSILKYFPNFLASKVHVYRLGIACRELGGLQV